MTVFLAAIALFLLLNIFAGTIRLVRGPTPADRMLAVQLFGSTGVALLMILAELTSEPALHNVALVFALFAVMAVVAFARRVLPATEREEGPQ
jgi:multicomponent Na+:H+ antiporter subunit F